MNNIPKGWQCPVCGRVYAPHIPSCHSCNKRDGIGDSNATTTSTPSYKAITTTTYPVTILEWDRKSWEEVELKGWWFW